MYIDTKELIHQHRLFLSGLLMYVVDEGFMRHNDEDALKFLLDVKKYSKSSEAEEFISEFMRMEIYGKRKFEQVKLQLTSEDILNGHTNNAKDIEAGNENYTDKNCT